MAGVADVPEVDMMAEMSRPWSTLEEVYVVLFAVAVAFQVANVYGLLKDLMRELYIRFKHGSVWQVRSTADLGTVSIVVPCYMPNEHSIIEGTLQHLFEELEFEDKDENTLEGGRVTVYCVYNAPKSWEHPIEKKLAEMDGKSHGPWNRRFRSIRVDSSTSKAENLNHVLPLLETTHTVIYDADHHPDAQSLRIAAERLHQQDLDCVQGSTYIRSGHGLMGCLIDAEFFFNYFIIFRCLTGLTGTGFFGGSNAFWRTEALQSQLFDPKVQTEDIEYSLRALLRQMKIGFCPEARSGELAPSSWSALWRQRRRWALGWDQVTLRHTSKLLCSSELPICSKVALFYTFILRWVSIVAMLVLACVHPVLIGVELMHYYLGVEEPFDLHMFNDGIPAHLMFASSCAFSVLLVTTVFTLCSVERPLRRFMRQLCFVAIFFIGAMVPILLMALLQAVSFYAIYRGNTAGWVVTARSGSKPAHKKLDEQVSELSPKEPDAAKESASTDGGSQTCSSNSIQEPEPESPIQPETVQTM